MKTLFNLIKAVLEPVTFSREKMPALIPVRVVTKVRPDQNK
ncbi:MAG TPA: hypothetical protein VL978_09325 [Puia sp.]|nr:hypothetical protein [Puia sp.]